MTNTHQAHIFVSGFVQGVGYRYFVKKNARRLGLTGWVRNKHNGQVEAVLQGGKEIIEKLIELCRKGPFLAEVKDLVIEWEIRTEEYQGFETRSTI